MGLQVSCLAVLPKQEDSKEALHPACPGAPGRYGLAPQTTDVHLRQSTPSFHPPLSRRLCACLCLWNPALDDQPVGESVCKRVYTGPSRSPLTVIHHWRDPPKTPEVCAACSIARSPQCLRWNDQSSWELYASQWTKFLSQVVIRSTEGGD